jgi:hypothetical protein
VTAGKECRSRGLPGPILQLQKHVEENGVRDLAYTAKFGSIDYPTIVVY